MGMHAILRGDRGSGYPVLYVPGIDGTGELMLGTAQRVEAHFRLVRVAYRAEGNPQDDSYAGLAASIARCCEEQGVDRCLVVAESFGGAVALQLAFDYPELVAGLMIVNSFAHFPQPKRLWLSGVLSGWIPQRLFDFSRRTLAPKALFGRRESASVLAAFRALPGAFFDGAYRRRIAMIRKLDLRPRLGELGQPLMLFASDQDRIVPAASTLGDLAKRVPHSTLCVVQGAGHLILPLEDEPWVERLRELQTRISE
jgi:pimeloyl-ACP methyl ester carboxylesterase